MSNYSSVIFSNAFDNRFAVAILRMPGGIDSSKLSGSVNGIVNTAFAEESRNNWSSNTLSDYSLNGKWSSFIENRSKVYSRVIQIFKILL